MKKMISALLALLLIALPALAETAPYQGAGYTVVLPENLAVLPEETVQGYFSAAEADAGAALDGAEADELDTSKILLAASEDGQQSLSIIPGESDGRTAAELGVAAREDLTDLVTGLSARNLEEQTIGALEFASVRYTLYGSEVAQYYTVVGETVFCLTFTNLDDDVIEAVLASFAPEA